MNAIVSVCADWGIGLQGNLLVPNKEDMKYFVSHTKSTTVLMGRKTLLSFPGHKPLKDRRNLVVSRNPKFKVEGAEVFSTPEAALAATAKDERVFLIGGGSLYQQLIDSCEFCYVTYHDCRRPADTYFPNLDLDEAWKLVDISDVHTTPEGVPFTFRVYENQHL